MNIELLGKRQMLALSKNSLINAVSIEFSLNKILDLKISRLVTEMPAIIIFIYLYIELSQFIFYGLDLI